MQAKMKRIVVEIPDKTKKELVKEANKNGQTLSYIIRNLINERQKTR